MGHIVVNCLATMTSECYFDYCPVTCLTTTAGLVCSLSLLGLLLLYISQQSFGSLSKLVLARRTEEGATHAAYRINTQHNHYGKTQDT